MSSGLKSGLDPKVASALYLSADITRYYQLSDLVVVLGYGIYLPIFLKSVKVVKSRIRSSVPSRWLLVLLLSLFVTTTTHLVSGLSTNFTLLDWPRAASLQAPIAVKLQAAASNAQLATEAFFYSGRINIALIDAIVVWRAYVLQTNNRPIRIVLAFLLVITISYSIGMMVITPDPERFGISGPLSNALNVVRDALALALNIIATVCIACTAWTYSNYMKRSIPTSNPSVPTLPFVNRVFQVILEGGVILALIQIGTITLGLFTSHSTSDPTTLTSPKAVGFMIITEILITASAIYPSLMTVLVAEEQQCTLSDGSTVNGTVIPFSNSRTYASSTSSNLSVYIDSEKNVHEDE